MQRRALFSIVTLVLVLSFSGTLPADDGHETPPVAGSDALDGLIHRLTRADAGPRPRPAPAGRTDNRVLQSFLEELELDLEGGDGQWSFTIEGLEFILLTDESANRMRLISPVLESAELASDELLVLMEANFDRALDAKYAIWRGVLWSTFVHSLGELTRGEFDNALWQVGNLVRTYGTSYSSTDMIYGSSDTEPDPEP